jgi:hypothetical protein
MLTIDLKTIMLAALFVFFLSPITLGVAFSSNYFFLLFPLMYILRDSKIYALQGDIKGIFLVYCIIFFVAAILQYSYWDLMPRKLTSFILFITLFSFAIIEMSQRMIDAFKLATIVYIILSLFREPQRATHSRSCIARICCKKSSRQSKIWFLLYTKFLACIFLTNKL